MFPSISGGWVISEENFFQNLNQNALSFLKLRASWGLIGNERIGNYAYMSSMAFGNSLFYQDGNIVSNQTAAQRHIAYEDITWEKTETVNIGADLNFFNNKLRFVADVYRKKTRDMLIANTWIPDFMGYGIKEINAAKMSTNGFDIELAWNDRINDFRYGVTFTLSDFISKIDYMAETDHISNNKIKRAGVGFNEWYGFVSDGIYQDQDDIINSPTLSDQVKVGDIKYKDISGPDGVPDGIISSAYDRVPLGNSLPRFQYGSMINLGYKDFDFAIVFQGIGKQNVRLEREMVEPLRGNYGNIPDIIDLNYWSIFNTKEQNLKAKYPRLTHANRDNNYAMSDFWIFNGRYLRLKNITLGYNIPSHLIAKAGVNGLRIYASANDLLSLSKYPSGWDPEMGASAYPITTSLIFGLSVKF